MDKILESFNKLPVYSFKIEESTRNTVKISGVALRGNVTTKNNRLYMREALLKATNTWIGKLVNRNHDNSIRIGTINEMDYDMDTDELRYKATINKQPYVDMIREHNPDIRGTSIQADYLQNVCSISGCGKHFYTEEDWYNHVTTDHFVKNPPRAPHGIIGNGLALVVAPEEPGYDSTSMQIDETVNRDLSKLSEMIAQVKTEEEIYMSNKLKNAGAAVETASHVVPQLASSYKSPIAEPKPTVTTVVNPVAAEPAPAATITVEPPEITLPNLTTISETSEQKTLREAANLPKLTYTTETAEYPSFEACVASGKTRMECAAIFDKTEETNKRNKQAVDAYNRIVEYLNTPLTVSIPKYDDKQLRESIQAQVNTVVEAVKNIKFPEYKDDTTWKDIKPYDDTTLKEAVAAIKPYDDAALKTSMEAISKTLTENLAQTTQKLTLLETQQTKIEEWYKTNLAAYEKDIKEFYKPEIAKLTDELQKLKETQTKTVIRTDNLEEKLQPQFKGKNPPVTSTTPGYTPRNPLEGK